MHSIFTFKHYQSINTLDEKTIWRESETIASESLFINRTVSGRSSIPLAGGHRIATVTLAEHGPCNCDHGSDPLSLVYTILGVDRVKPRLVIVQLLPWLKRIE